MIAASEYDTAGLLAEWHWLVPKFATPLFISAFGDWVFGHPDGSLWILSLLEGNYHQVARNAAEYNTLNKSIECLGWKAHPVIGGKFAAANLQVFSMAVYQSLMGQLHRQLRFGP
jgi:hypothetical protein